MYITLAITDSNVSNVNTIQKLMGNHKCMMLASIINIPPIELQSQYYGILFCLYRDFSVQWNPYIADTIEELHVGRYRGLAVAEGFYMYYMNEIWT